MKGPNLFRLIGLAVALLASCGILWYWISTANDLNGGPGFPLDDPWIHLQFARNIHDYGSYSYYKDEMVTAGSTSPLYTFLLAAGLFVTSNEFVLSYALGILFLVGAGLLFFRVVAKTHGSWEIAATATLALLIEPRLHWAALSGMETTLFVFMLLAVLASYVERKPLLLGLAAGLLIWTRPEGVIFLASLGASTLYEIFWAKPATTHKGHRESLSASIRWLQTPSVIALILIVCYGVFNLGLSGSFFPNTLRAKIAYYSGGTATNFPSDFVQFVAGGHMVGPAILAVMGLISLVVGISKRQKVANLTGLLWIVGMFFAFWKNLPFLFQEGRYMMPILPFFLLLAIEGSGMIAALLSKMIKASHSQRTRQLTGVILVLLIVVSNFSRVPGAAESYAESCRYITSKQVMTADWIRSHLPESAIIGTHDIGAIGYYSGRRVADMVGLVSPEMISNIGSLDGLKGFLKQKKVTHLAVLHNWFEITNQNPLFETDRKEFEVMQVFEFDSVYTHITPSNAGRRTNIALQHLSQGQLQTAGPLLEQSLSIDPDNAKTHYCLGLAYFMARKLDDAEREFNVAVRLHPQFWDAELSLAQVDAQKNRPDSAIARTERLVRKNPAYPPAYRALADLFNVRRDTTQAREFMRKYEELMAAAKGIP